jgi:hypothetical protein
MSVRIQFDQPESRPFTNLDFISGNVILVLPTDATISAVTVKLEGESRTRLAASRPGYSERSEKKRTELEVHKILYKVLTVFPTPELRERGSTPVYTLLAGQYSYRFEFKFPFNNDCQNNQQNPLKDLKIGRNLQLDDLKHVKKTLPPSLTGFPGEAEVKYYVKVTVARPKFYQENLRTIVDIKFLPIEPPRPANRHEETFARRKKQFQRYPSEPQKRSLFSKKGSTTTLAEDEPPAFQVDARLPSPAILTCNEPLPLRILVEKLNDSAATVCLKMLQIELIGYTHIRAMDLDRQETMTWVLTSQANMNMPLGNPSEKGGKEWKVPSRLWDDFPIPNTVCPSFQACNISRRYELEVRIGLAHADTNGVRPELIVMPLRLPVLVYSGIAPPEKLLQAMAKNPRPQPPLMMAPSPVQSIGENTTVWPSSGGLHTPIDTPSTPLDELNAYPAMIGTQHSNDEQSDIPDVAPPSYEDAMAEDIAPVDGPRRDYNVAEDVQRPAFNPDSKGGLGRRVSERLFSGNASSSDRDRAASLASNMEGTSIAEDEGTDMPNPTLVEGSERKSSWRQSLSRGKN